MVKWMPGIKGGAFAILVYLPTYSIEYMNLKARLKRITENRVLKLITYIEVRPTLWGLLPRLGLLIGRIYTVPNLHPPVYKPGVRKVIQFTEKQIASGKVIDTYINRLIYMKAGKFGPAEIKVHRHSRDVEKGYPGILEHFSRYCVIRPVRAMQK